jgi:hypothetical protein
MGEVTGQSEEMCIMRSSVLCMISGFRRDIDEICALVGYYAALSGSSVPTFRDNLSVPFFRLGLLDP